MKKFTLIVMDQLRGGGGIAFVSVFFATLCAALFAIALAPQPQMLAAAAMPVIWLVVLLAALLPLEALWHRPLLTGRFDLLLLSGVPPLLLAAAVMLVHFLVTGLPLTVAAIILTPMLQAGLGVLPVLLPSLVLGTLYLSLMGGVGAILTIGARQPGMLMALLILPLMLPMLLLGMMAAEQAMLVGAGINPYLLWQAVLVLLTAPLLILLGGVLLRHHFFR